MRRLHLLALLSAALLVGCDGSTPSEAPLTPPAPNMDALGTEWVSEPLVLQPLQLWAKAWAINDAGIAVGSSPNGYIRAVRWAPDGTMESWADYFTHAYAHDINDAGMVMGDWETVDPKGIFAWVNGQMIDGPFDQSCINEYGDFNDALTRAWDLNGSDEIIATTWSYRLPDGACAARSFIWKPGASIVFLDELGLGFDLSAPGGTGAKALVMNSDGQIAGYVAGEPRLYTPGAAIRDLAGLSDIVAINENGEVLGDNGVWTPEGFLALPTDLHPTSFNEAGQIVGSGPDGAAVWTEEGGSRVLPGTDGNAATVNDINNAGDAVGYSESDALKWTTVRPIWVKVTPGTVKLNIHGMLTVAILSSHLFDAPGLIDPATVAFGSTGVATRGNGALMASADDVNGDGRPDLVVHFDRGALISNGDLAPATSNVVVTGTTWRGLRLRGQSPVVVR